MYPRAVLLILLIHCFALAQGQIEITTTRPDNIFESGEEMNFILSSPTSGEFTYRIFFDSRTSTIESGKISLSAGVDAYLPFTLHEPGTVIIETINGSDTVQLGVAFSPFSIGIYDACPADFDAFWTDQKNQLSTIPIDPVLTFMGTSSAGTTYRVNLACIDNRRVYGYITIPTGTGPFPAILTLPPNGDDANIANPEPIFAELHGAISMSISIHNVEPDEVDPNSYLPNNTADREGVYYRTSILAGIRAIDYIFSRPDFDNTNMVLTGVSQGGGLALCVAGIDSRIKALTISNPALCEHAAYKYSRASGFPYYNWSAAMSVVENINEDVYEATKYYDAKYFAQRIHAPCLFTTGYRDLICPTATVFGATNQLRGPKLAVHALRLEHSSPQQYWDGRRNFFVRHIPAFASPIFSIGKGHYADAGADKTGIQNQPLTISGSTFDDDTMVSNWPVRWELLDGPGKAVFGDASSRSTTVSFDQAGTYTLRFSANADELLTSDGILFTMEDFITLTIN